MWCGVEQIGWVTRLLESSEPRRYKAVQAWHRLMQEPETRAKREREHARVRGVTSGCKVSVVTKLLWMGFGIGWCCNAQVAHKERSRIEV